MSNAFDEVQFPVSIALGATGGPGWSTVVVVLSGGYEKRNQNWANARGKWDVSTGIKNAADMAIVDAFFRARFGRAVGFRFKDWRDFNATNEVCGGLANGTNTIFQLQKTYTSGPGTSIRTISKPVASPAPQIFVNGVLQTITTNYTLDTTTGILTMVAPPAYVPTWTGQFDVPVRFDSDDLDIAIEDMSGGGAFLSRASKIPIIELRV